MNQLFVDRYNELKFLEEKYREKRSQLIIVYGRRRIGKTELLLKFSQNKPHIYFLCEKTSNRTNITKLSRKMAEYLKKKSFSRIVFEDWEDLFREFVEWKDENDKIVIILDEFQYLIEMDKGVLSLFQRIWDLYLSRREDIMLILCGSSIGMIETEVLGYKSPLYGRRTGQWRVNELELKYIKEFVPNYDYTDLVYVYGTFGGVPAYLTRINPNITFLENIRRLFLQKGEFLYEEAENLLRQELREPRNYKLILRALAEGYRRVVEISNMTGLDKATVSRYLDTLELLDIVSYEIPVLEKPKTRKRLYYIKDNYFNFWFRFIDVNRDLIEEGREEIVLEEITNNLDNYISFIYERIAKKLLQSYPHVPFRITKIGREWGKSSRGEAYEIDLLGYNRNKTKYLALEVKWSDLNSRDIERILKRLRKTIEKIGVKGEIFYGVIARRIYDKKEIKNNLILLDLKDLMEHILK
ncbi:MAG: ATP-binding protein [Thermoprotei archaeon]|nr:MAG: ATP-binding protein [Thermoprotei archaeon]